MERLIDCFEFQGKQIVSLIGSGGKTSLMWYLADCFRQETVLVSTTTKIGFPKQSFFDFFYSEDFSNIGMNGSGITLAGNIIDDGRKLSAPPQPTFRKLSCFDKVFLEADGSKQLPLKGWETFEPVVIPETTTTIGVIPISVLEKKMDHSTIHRLSLFLKAIGANQGECIQEETLVAIISNSNGLFAKSVGQRMLCLNQVETSTQLRQAQKVVDLLPSKILNGLTKIIACSVQSKKGEVLWEK